MIHRHTNLADTDDRAREAVITPIPIICEAVLAIADPAGGAEMVLLTADQIRMLHALMIEATNDSSIH